MIFLVSLVLMDMDMLMSLVFLLFLVLTVHMVFIMHMHMLMSLVLFMFMVFIMLMVFIMHMDMLVSLVLLVFMVLMVLMVFMVLLILMWQIETHLLFLIVTKCGLLDHLVEDNHWAGHLYHLLVLVFTLNVSK